MSDYENDDDTGEAEVSSQFLDDSLQSQNSNGGSKISNFAQSSDALEESSAPQVAEETDEGEPLISSSSQQQRGQGRANGSRAEFTTAFDIIDEMQKNLDEAKSSLFTPATAKINRDEYNQYLDELKKVLPVQLERASALMRESERRLEAAQDQSESIARAAQRNAEAIVSKANEQADFLAGHQNVVALAEEKARGIISAAQAKADKVTLGANEYSDTILSNLNAELDKLSRDVKGGISILRTRQQEAASKLDRIDGDADEENR